MATGIKPIETLYAGYRFRSRLEARWAIFFDACRITYDYEPDGYKLSDGTVYLPDFLLHDVNVFNNKDMYIEVKGAFTEKDVNKIQLFSQEIAPIFTVGLMPKVVSDTRIDTHHIEVNDIMYNAQTLSHEWYWYFPCINQHGEFDLVGTDCWHDEIDAKKTAIAYRAAQQARFEHGETPDQDKIRGLF